MKDSEIKGGNRTMRCSSTFGTAPVSFSWLTTTLEHTTPFIIYPGIVDEAKYTVTSGVSLSLCGGSPCLQCTSPAECYVEVRVLDLEVKDSGTYTCQTQNFGSRQKIEENFEINVLDKPNAIYVTKKSNDGSVAERFNFNETHQTNVPVIWNSHVSINFTVEDSYPSAKISCTASELLEEKVEIVGGREQFTKTVTQTIEFMTVKSLQIIRCQVVLQHDSYPVVTWDIHIDVQYPPLGPVNFDVREPEPTSTNTTTGLKTYEVHVDQVLEFTCTIPEQGNPKGKVGLVRDGSQDQINGRVVERENSIIEFTVDSHNQTGMYRCSVQNYLAHEPAAQNQKIEIKVIEAVPSAPSKLRIMSVSDTSVTVEWDVPEETNGVIRGYNLSWSSHNHTTQGHTDVESDVHSYTITSLNCYTSCLIEIRAKTTAGFGDPAQLNVTTLEGDASLTLVLEEIIALSLGVLVAGIIIFTAVVCFCRRKRSKAKTNVPSSGAVSTAARRLLPSVPSDRPTPGDNVDFVAAVESDSLWYVEARKPVHYEHLRHIQRLQEQIMRHEIMNDTTRGQNEHSEDGNGQEDEAASDEENIYMDIEPWYIYTL